MKRFLVLSSLFAALVAPLNSGSQAAPAQDANLASLNWLVGTWRGEGRTPDGKPATNEFRFERSPNGKAFQYTILRTAEGKTSPVLVGLCAWHPAKRQLMLWEVDGEGALTESTLTVAGDTLDYREVIHGADGSILPVRARGIRQGTDTFRFTASIEQKGEWRQVFETTWRRVP
jgi:hypothetical protein